MVLACARGAGPSAWRPGAASGEPGRLRRWGRPRRRPL